MPAVIAQLHVRDNMESNSTDPGQRVSIDGGIDSKKNIIAMILATVLFIVVVVSYQYFSTVMARREQEQLQIRARHRRPRSQADVSTVSRLSQLMRRWISFFKAVIAPKPLPEVSRTDSTEVLLKQITPRPPPRRPSLITLPCMSRRRKEAKLKEEARRIPRPLLLRSDSTYTYSPRNPIDEDTYELLRSPDAFAEFSDPIRNMSFVRVQTEVQRRKERDEIWYEEPLDSPKKPVVACVAPLAFRKKLSLLREGEDTDIEKAQPDPERPSPPRSIFVSSPQQSLVRDALASPLYAPRTHRPLSNIQEEPDSPAPWNFFEVDDDDQETMTEAPRRTIRLRFPLPSPTKASMQDDVDVFSIGSFSISDESSDSEDIGH